MKDSGFISQGLGAHGTMKLVVDDEGFLSVLHIAHHLPSSGTIVPEVDLICGGNVGREWLI